VQTLPLVAVPGRDSPPRSTGRPAADGPAKGLPAPLSAALAEFGRHLAAERVLSRHTVRAYQGDIQSLLEYACRCGVDDLGALDLATLRGWLAELHQAGAARATLARRGAAARAFTAYASRRGWLAVDPGPQLGTPKAHRVLPQVLRREEMNSVLADCEDRALRELAAGQRTAAAVAMRDAAVLELLYATAVRVSELCELDLGGIDAGRRTVRVLGKGRKERVVPVGLPAMRALARWEEAGRPVLANERSGNALFLGARGGRLDPAAGRGPGGGVRGDPCGRRGQPGRGPGGLAVRGGRRVAGAGRGPARDQAYCGDAPSRGGRGPAQRAGDLGPCLPGDDADLHACVGRAAEGNVPPGPPPRLTTGGLGLAGAVSPHRASHAASPHWRARPAADCGKVTPGRSEDHWP
jgi:integrase/recombinase XerC